MARQAAAFTIELLYFRDFSIRLGSGFILFNFCAFGMLRRLCFRTLMAWVFARIHKSSLWGWDLMRENARLTLPKSARRFWHPGQEAIWFCSQLELRPTPLLIISESRVLTLLQLDFVFFVFIFQTYSFFIHTANNRTALHR